MAEKGFSVDLKKEFQQVLYWTSEAESLLLRVPPERIISIYRESNGDMGALENIIIMLRGISHTKWIDFYKMGKLNNPPSSWAGGNTDRFEDYAYAPVFFKHVVEPRFKSRPADVEWILNKTIELTTSHNLAKALVLSMMLYLDVLLTAENAAGAKTYQLSGATSTDDPGYWEARAKAFELFGLNLSGEAFIKKALPRADEILAILAGNK